MALSDQVAQLEDRLQTGTITQSQFDQQLAALLHAAAGVGQAAPNVPAPARVAGLVSGPVPTHMGAYELLELLGQGGMGAVYLAKHLLKPGLFAVKVPRVEVLSQPGFGRRFRREASVGLKLDHPGIVRVHDLIIDGDWAAIVMDFVAGPNIETLLRNQGGPLAKERVLDMMVQILDAMEYAHTQGVVHRDLKPKNLMMRPDGQVQVTDFGVAWLAGSEDTQAGTAVVGTAPYMAPELYTGLRSIDQRADIYALGMTLYKLSVGQLPFPSTMTSYQVLRAKEAGRVPMPAHLPQALQDVIRTAVAPDPDERFATCGDFKQALEAAAKEDWATSSETIKIVHEIAPPRPRHASSPMQYAVVTLLVLVLAALSWLTLEVRREVILDDASSPDAVVLEEASGETAEPAAADRTPAGEDGTDDSRQRPGDHWTIGGVSGGGLPARQTPNKDELAVRGSAAVKLRAGAAEAAPPIADPTPTRRATQTNLAPILRTAIARPQEEAGGTVVSIPTEPRPEPKAVRGTMILSSSPEARVFVDGKDMGTTAQTLEGLVLVPGQHTVRFVCESPACDGFEQRDHEVTLVITAGETTRYVEDFEHLNRARSSVARYR
jgi:serine/threonine protein kinase